MRVILAVIAAMASGCVYLDVVNLPPVAVLEHPAGEIHIGDAVLLTAASSHDDDHDPLTFDWQCLDLCVFQQGDLPSRYTVTPQTHDPVRVTVTVRDSHGAGSTASTDLVITDRAPTLDVRAQESPGPSGTYPVHKAIHVGATPSDPDGDSVTLRFALHPPPASDPNQVSFTRVTGTSDVWTLVPDVPGQWEVEVTADDGFGGKTVGTRGLEVGADAPPCIAGTSPLALPGASYLLQTSDGPRRFAVASVQDDLDPWPAADSQLSFRWFLGAAAAPPEIAGHDLADFTLDPADHLPGDTLTLRVEIADRTARTLPCAPDQAECSIGGDACLQRVSWTVEIR